MQNVIDFLNSIKPMSPELILHLESILKYATFNKRQFVHDQGKICKYIWFIEKGALGSFYERHGKQLCSWFMMEGDVITVVRSFFTQVKSYESIQAIEDTHTWYISYNELQWIYENFPEFNYHGRILTEKYYQLSDHRLYLLHNQTAAQKYKYLLENFPK